MKSEFQHQNVKDFPTSTYILNFSTVLELLYMQMSMQLQYGYDI